MECSAICELDERDASYVPSFLRPLGEHVWVTASGRRIAHVIYSLIGCPAPTAAVYLLVRREGTVLRVLATGRTRSRYPSLNLSRIRRAGATLGATEVHVYATPTLSERIAIHADLNAAIDPHIVSRLRVRRRTAGATRNSLKRG